MPRFGVSLVPVAGAMPETLALARTADAAGLELIGVQDHPYQAQFADTMTLIGAVLEATDRVSVFPDVASIPLRPPAMLAKASATLDLLSGGRFELGIGSGAVWPAIAGYGGDSLRPRQAVDALVEAIEVIRAIWSGERGLTVDGEFHALRGAHGGPVPAHDIGVWIGSVGPRMLGLTGRLGDGWAAPIPSYLPYEEQREAQDRINEGADAAGRPRTAVRRIAQIPGTITDGRDEGAPRGADPLVGPVERWVDALVTLGTDVGFDDFILWPEQPDEHQVRVFAEEVAPAVRAALAAPGR